MFSLIAAFGAALVPISLLAAPVPDASFGDAGRVHLGVPTGFEDTVYASTLQPDGKVVVAGISSGRQSYTFVTRFTTAGAPDPSFGAGGRLLISDFGGTQLPLQIEAAADGTSWLVSSSGERFVVTAIDARGQPLDIFNANGSAYTVNDPAAYRGALRLILRADGGQLFVTDASAGGAFALRLRRYQPLAYGTPDFTFGPDGERVLANLPPNFAFTSTQRAVAEPGGGFTLVANGTFPGSTYLVLRVTADGALDPSFGGIGYVSGHDASNPRDVPTQIVRTPDGGYVLFGHPVDANGNAIPGKHIAWKLDASGQRVVAFGIGGLLSLPDSNTDPVGAAFADGTIAIAQKALDTNTLFLTRYDAGGQPLSQFGSNGASAVTVAGYLAFNPIGLYRDASGRIDVAGWGYSRASASGLVQVFRGSDALVAGLTDAGAPRADFGRGDGIGAWNNPALSNDRLDAIRFDGEGRILLAGYSDGTGASDYLLTRLTGSGAIDASYGAGGRLYPNQVARFIGPARAALQPDDAIVVASGEALGSFGGVRSVTMFRATPDGALDTAFHPAALPAGANAAVALGAQADGRIVYGTIDGSSAVLQQFLPDGAPDPAFGTGGRVAFPIGENPVIQGDLVVLADGSIAFAVFLSESIRIFKVDAHGVPAAGFGANGQVVQGAPHLQQTFSIGPTLLALADGSLLAAQRVTLSDPTPASPPVNSLYVVRLSATTGQVLRAEQVLTSQTYASFVLAALPDASVLIARNIDYPFGGPRADLHRMFPDGSFDASFGVASGYFLSMTQVNALAIDPAGRLVVSGQVATGAVVARYTLGGDVASVVVVEFFNTLLGHYFVTAGPGEIANIESGGAGPGWQRTGLGFRAYIPESGVAVAAASVCRFYGTPGLGPNSHFYTASAAECAAVKSDPGWTYEGIAFYIPVPAGGQCASGTTAVYRSYNKRFAQNDSNHRYTTDAAVYDTMVAQGWAGEGIVMCSPG
jgi:uncharacterized delta-60 repeat protein